MIYTETCVENRGIRISYRPGTRGIPKKLPGGMKYPEGEAQGIFHSSGYFEGNLSERSINDILYIYTESCIVAFTYNK